MSPIIIYKIDDYKNASTSFIKNSGIKCDSLDTWITLLKKDDGYHERILKNGTYKLFADIDGEIKTIDELKEILITFYKKHYNLDVNTTDIKMTNSTKIYEDNINKKSYTLILQNRALKSITLAKFWNGYTFLIYILKKI